MPDDRKQTSVVSAREARGTGRQKGSGLGRVSGAKTNGSPVALFVGARFRVVRPGSKAAVMARFVRRSRKRGPIESLDSEEERVSARDARADPSRAAAAPVARGPRYFWAAGLRTGPRADAKANTRQSPIGDAGSATAPWTPSIRRELRRWPASRTRRLGST